MDVRLSPEQVAPARCRGAGGRSSGRPRRRRARRPRACRQARRRGGRVRLARACARRPTTGRPGPRRSRSRSSPRSSDGAWPTPPSSVRPWRPSSAAAPGRPTAGGSETVALRRRPRRAGDGRGRAWRPRVPSGSTPRTARSGPGARRRRGRLDHRRGRARSAAPRRAAASTSPGPSRPSPTPGTVDGASAGSPVRSAATTWPRWRSLGLAVTSADLVGVMRGALDLTTDYARSARSTAPPSGRSRRCSTCWPTPSSPWRARAASPSTRPGPWTRCRRPDALAAASAAKAYCARAARSVCETAIQVHGGIGNTWECLAHVFLRRARCSRARCSAASAPNLARVLAARNIGGRRWTSLIPPRSSSSACACAPGSSAEQPRPAGLVDGRRVLGRAGRLAPDALRRRLLRAVLADRGRRARAAQRLRGDPRRGAHHRRHAAAAERGLPRPGAPRGTGTRTCGAASCPGWSAAGSAGARASASPTPGRTWPRCARAPCGTATEYVITGHKVWTSYSDAADWCLVLARTDPDVAEAQGHLGLHRADGPARHRAAAAADDQRDHARVRRGALRRGPRRRGQHDRRAGRGLAPGHDRRQPRARARRARLRGALRQARQRAGARRRGRPRPSSGPSSGATWPGRWWRPRCCAAT